MYIFIFNYDISTFLNPFQWYKIISNMLYLNIINIKHQFEFYLINREIKKWESIVIDVQNY